MSKHSQYQQNYRPPTQTSRSVEFFVDCGLCFTVAVLLALFLIAWIDASV